MAKDFTPVFRKGQRIKLSKYAKQCGIKLQSRANGRGTVIEQHSALGVRVRPDNYKTVRDYYVGFWEAVR